MIKHMGGREFVRNIYTKRNYLSYFRVGNIFELWWFESYKPLEHIGG